MLLHSVYPDHDQDALLEQAVNAILAGRRDSPEARRRARQHALERERDSYVITYGNSLIKRVNTNRSDLLFDFLPDPA